MPVLHALSSSSTRGSATIGAARCPSGGPARHPRPTGPAHSAGQPHRLRFSPSALPPALNSHDHTAAAMDASRGDALMDWLKTSGAPPQKVALKEVIREGRPLDVTVATEDLAAGDVALAIPERLLINLDTVFDNSSDLAEALTTTATSELSCLALFLMYEKRAGPASPWAPLIRELDRIQARGAQGAKSPLLWEDGQAAALLAGSPLAGEVAARAAAIEKEYGELDTIWFMAPPLFDRRGGGSGGAAVPPTETFSLPLFRAAYTAVQASVVHLMGVPSSSKRFALVPLGPPLLQYKSTSRASLAWTDTGVGGGPGVVWAADTPVSAGEALAAWCGPQPNRRLLLNYGIVDEGNPFDFNSLTVTLPSSDPLFPAKRAALQRGFGPGGPPGGQTAPPSTGRGGPASSSSSAAAYSTQHAFRLTRTAPLPGDLLPYLRLALTPDPAAVARPDALAAAALPGSLGPAVEAAATGALAAHLSARLARYPTTIAQDDATVASEAAGPREKVAARLVRIEKAIWGAALEAVQAVGGGGGGGSGGSGGSGGEGVVQGVRLS